MNKTPNIVLINCDDLGYGDVGCYGSLKNDTPYIDSLCKEGMKFTDFYMASPVCSPSRGAMMTGCYPPRISFANFDGGAVLFPGQGIGLHKDEITIAKLLKEASYNTMIVGKWHCGDQEEFLPTNHGFDDYFGIPFSNDMGRMIGRESTPPLPLLHGTSIIQEQPDLTSITERYVEKSVEFIRANKENPFFLYLAHMHVHLPLYAAPMFVKKSRNGDYGACVGAIDWAMGCIVNELKQQGVYDDTIIIFTSDNGSRNDFGESNGELHGTKATTWDGGIRVPLIVSWPSKIKAGSESSEIVSAIDLYPTLANICGAKIPTDRIIDGLDFSDLLLGKTDKSPRDTFFYYMIDKLEAVRAGDWKLFVSRNGEQVFELYNLRDDISENNNLYKKHPEIVEMLIKEIEKCRVDMGDAVTGVKGENVREIGRVSNPHPLTQYDENHPYIIALYDRGEAG